MASYGAERGRREGKQTEEAGSELWAGDGGRALAVEELGQAAEGRLQEFPVESTNTRALLHPATVSKENQLVTTVSPFPPNQDPDLDKATRLVLKLVPEGNNSQSFLV